MYLFSLFFFIENFLGEAGNGQKLRCGEGRYVKADVILNILGVRIRSIRMLGFVPAPANNMRHARI